MKPITRQLIVAAFILALVTAASLGIRQVRFGIHRTRAVKNPVITETESAPVPAESNTVDAEPDPQYAGLPEPEEQETSDDYAEVHTESGKDGKAVSKTQLSKGEYAKAKGSKGSLEKISLGENENLYITAKGETWYVSKDPDGETVKMQVHIDDATGEIIVVDAKSRGSKSLQKISMGGNDNIYITEEGQAWYVTDDYKAQVEIDDTTGEVTVVEQHGKGDKF
ncbi:MAG: hypothetical protein JSW47_03345 [Phycisphaerales bacterium]|nr:MAG: hypothetical protein JSW47_03345 [Phycisphaerales bacterium]